MFIISVSEEFALGVVYSTRELAETAAARMGILQYKIRQVFTEGERVVFRAFGTGPEQLGTIREILNDRYYTVDLDDGKRIGVRHTELSAAPAKWTESDSPAITTLRQALLETTKEYAEYDHPCDSDAEDLDKAHGSVSIHVLRELLARHS